MGNQLSQPQKLQPEHLAEVPKVVLKENLGAHRYNHPLTALLLEGISPRMWNASAGGGRFLKTLLCLHDDGGLVVVKVTLSQEVACQLGSTCLPSIWPVQHVS